MPIVKSLTNWLLAGLLCWSLSGNAEPLIDNEPVVAIVFDDLGYQLGTGMQAVSLPYTLNYSFLPHTPHSRQLAELAVQNGGEVMLHLPMASLSEKELGPGALHAGMEDRHIREILQQALDSVPHVSGINNHMGSALTQDANAMQQLMLAIIDDERTSYFLDSRTTATTVAESTAREVGLATSRRNIFIDHFPVDDFIEQQLELLINHARKHGTAIGIAHPYPETLTILSQQLPQLEKQGIRLVHVSEIIKRQDRRKQQWLAKSWSPSHRDAKNLNPLPSSTCCDGPVLK